MTHTLHRQGSQASLEGDFVVLMMAAKGRNDAGAAGRLREFLRLADDCGAVNLGDMIQGSAGSGSSLTQLEQGVSDTSIVHAVFTSVDAAEAFVRLLQKAGLGLSVTITGPLAPLETLCRRVGLPGAPHTVAFSLGIAGAVELLPERPILEITTMCGHGLISPRLVEKAVAQIRSGETSPETAAQVLAGPCTCGVFNPERAARLLASLAESRSQAEEEGVLESDVR
ncbi:MAG: hypothetical protein ACE141_03845 [Bryobacteraceae bacterium]